MLAHTELLLMKSKKSSSARNSDHAPATTDHEQCSSLSQSQSQSQSQSRTYNCNFCKGGFSNAQALGGHMNIHRKDKAKLMKQSIPITESRQLQFLENTKTTPSPAYNLVHPTVSTNPERRAAVADNWTWNYYLEKTDTTSTSDQCIVGEPEQLLLFDKTTLNVEDDQDQQHSQEELSSPFCHGAELDLELRLGHESTSHSSSPAKGTRKFP